MMQETEALYTLDSSIKAFESKRRRGRRGRGGATPYGILSRWWWANLPTKGRSVQVTNAGR